MSHDKEAQDLMTPAYREALMHVGELYVRRVAISKKQEALDLQQDDIAIQLQHALQQAMAMDQAVVPLTKALDARAEKALESMQDAM